MKRRDFLEASGLAAVPVIGAAQPLAAQHLYLFGFELAVDTDPAGGKTVRAPAPSALPAGTQVLAWDVTLQGNRVVLREVRLRFAAAVVHLRFTVPCVASGGAYRLLEGSYDGIDPATPNPVCFILAPSAASLPAPGVHIDVGVLPVDGSFTPGALRIDAQGGLAVRAPNFLSSSFGRIAPIELVSSVGDSAGLIELALAQGRIAYAPGAFGLLTSARLVHGAAENEVRAEQRHDLRPHVVSLVQAAERAVLRFHGADEAIALHVERPRQNGTGSSGMYVGMRGHDYDLGLGLARTGRAVRADGMWLLPRLGGTRPLSLTTYALADMRNTAARWLVAGAAGVPLLVRFANRVRPATLLLGAPVDGMAVTPDRPGGGKLHGGIADALVSVGATAVLRSAIPPLEQSVANIPGDLERQFSKGLLAEASAPVLEWAANGLAFERARPGRAYRRRSGAPTVSTYRFSGKQMALPAIALHHLERAGLEDFSRTLRKQLDLVMVGRLAAQHEEVRHESARGEGPAAGAAAIGLSRVFVRDAGAAAAGPAPGAGPGDDTLRLAKSQVLHSFNVPNGAGGAPLAFEVTRPPDAPLDYVVAEVGASLDMVKIPPLNFGIALNNTDFTLDPLRAVAGITAGLGAGMPRAVLKLSRGLALAAILGKRRGWRDVEQRLPAYMLAPEWVGVILFGVPAGMGQTSPLRKLVPDSVPATLEFLYVALTPKKDDAGGDMGYSVAACLERDFTSDPGYGSQAKSEDDAQKLEVSFALNAIKGRWDMSMLQNLQIDCELFFERFLGLKNPQAKKILIQGLFERQTNTMQFAAHLDRPVKLLPEFNASDGGGPIRQALFKGAVLTLEGEDAHVSIDGSLELAPFEVDKLPMIDIGNIRAIDFTGLGIKLPQPKTLGRIWREISYPAMRVNFDGPRLSFGPLSMRLFSLGIDFDNKFDWGRLVNLKAPPTPRLKGPCLLFGIRFELMKLPAILQSSIETLTFELQIGAWPDVDFSHWPKANLAAGLSALGFDGFNLNLFRFIELSTDQVEIKRDNDSTLILLKQLRLSVCGTALIKGLDAAFITRGGQHGFLLRWANTEEVNWALSVEWLLLGHNINVPDKFVTDHLALADNKQGADFNDARKQLNEWTPQLIGPGDKGGDWLVGAGIKTLQGAFEGRFIYQEGRVCALALQGTFLEWLGLESGIAGAYFKGRRAEEDHFYLSMTVPAVTVGAVHFTGGVVAVDFGVNGNFQLDLGFPWQSDNGVRQWQRALGAIVTPFQGSGGMYIEYRRRTLDSGSKVMQLAAGYAIQAGLGAAFGAGIFHAWVTIGIYATVEGQLWLMDGAVAGLRMKGAIGVLFRGHAGLRWWIISIDIDICIGAEASITLSWSSPALCASGPPLLPGEECSDKITLDFQFTVYASVRASACIRVGFVKLCKSVTASIPMRVNYQLKL